MIESKIYTGGSNDWQNNRYAFMSRYNKLNGITYFGKAKKNGAIYDHIIDAKKENEIYNLLGEQEILNEVNKRFVTKAGDKERVLNNTLASQACCFNLFAPLKNRLDLASKLFSQILKKDDLIVTSIEIEFTPKKSNHYDETIGDQSVLGGTDADVAVFYDFNKTQKGILLMEFKYIEAEFSVCSSYKNKNGKSSNGVNSKNIRPICNSPEFYNQLLEPYLNSEKKQFDCGYLKFKNWQLLQHSKVFDLEKIKTQNSCPFRFSLNQIWRNMLLAEKVARMRGLNEFAFCVIAPIENSFLWKNNNQSVYDEFKKLLTDYGSEKFFKLELKNDLIDPLKDLVEGSWEKEWLKKFNSKYLVETK